MKKITIWIATLFPEYFTPLVNNGVLSKIFSKERKLKNELDVEIKILKISDYSPKDFKGVDDAPYGGGPGVVMRADVLKELIVTGICKTQKWDILQIKEKLHVIYTSARGKKWNQNSANDFSTKFFNPTAPSSDIKDLLFICGRYEGIDERFVEKYIDQEYSVGDFILSGGEIAVMTILDSSLRLIEGSLHNDKSAIDESFSKNNNHLLEYPHYTRPPIFEDKEVPAVLLSGNHKEIHQFREQEKIRITKKYRPDLLPSSR